MTQHVLIIDNFDSFTYNLVEYVSHHAEVTVHRNDVSLETIRDTGPDAIVISPGPGHPRNGRDIGVTAAVLREVSPTTPTLGVCLGLEAAVHVHGGTVGHAPEPVHGKSSTINHDGEGIFAGLEDPFVAGRYHSLIASQIPDSFEVSARSQDEGLVMGIRHQEHPITAVQFHPESVLTGVGHQLIENFLAITDRAQLQSL